MAAFGNQLYRFRNPTVAIPLSMSFAALMLVISVMAFAGVRHDPDEGAAAHIFQLLIAGQLPFAVFWAAKWFRHPGREPIIVLAAQIAAIAVALFPVWLLAL